MKSNQFSGEIILHHIKESIHLEKRHAYINKTPLIIRMARSTEAMVREYLNSRQTYFGDTSPVWALTELYGCKIIIDNVWLHGWSIELEKEI